MLIARHGGPEVLLLADLPEPQPAPGQVLVQVAATSVNPIDAKIRAGAVPALCPPLPACLHGDVAGTVLALGAGASGFAIGDAVYGCAGGVAGSDGALAQRMRCDPALLALAPRRLALPDCAGLPLVAITAWEALDRADVPPGSTVLVHAGSGGVGHLLVQLAVARGLVVHATASSSAKVALVRELGASEVLLGRPGVELAIAAGRYAAVFDTVGGAALAAAFAAVAPGGQVVTIAARSTQDLSPLHGKGASLHCVFMLRALLSGQGREAHGRILRGVAALVDAGRVRPLIDGERFPLAQAAAAHARLEAGSHCGKILIEHER